MKEGKRLTREKRGAILLLVALTAAAVVLYVTLGEKIQQYAQEPARLRGFVEEHPALGRLGYLAIAFVQVVVALIPGEPVEILGGYVFGAWEGTALFLLASAAGSMLVFWLVRRFGVKLVRVFFQQEQLDKLHFLHTKKGREFLFFLIFALPGTPKDLLSYFAGLTDVSTGLWLLICSVGRIPSVVTSMLGGDALGEGSYGKAAIVFGATLVLSGAGVLLYRGILKRHEKRQTENTPQSTDDVSAKEEEAE